MKYIATMIQYHSCQGSNNYIITVCESWKDFKKQFGTAVANFNVQDWSIHVDAAELLVIGRAGSDVNSPLCRPPLCTLQDCQIHCITKVTYYSRRQKCGIFQVFLDCTDTFSGSCSPSNQTPVHLAHVHGIKKKKFPQKSFAFSALC